MKRTRNVIMVGLILSMILIFSACADKAQNPENSANHEEEKQGQSKNEVPDSSNDEALNKENENIDDGKNDIQEKHDSKKENEFDKANSDKTKTVGDINEDLIKYLDYTYQEYLDEFGEPKTEPYGFSGAMMLEYQDFTAGVEFRNEGDYSGKTLVLLFSGDFEPVIGIKSGIDVANAENILGKGELIPEYDFAEHIEYKYKGYIIGLFPDQEKYGVVHTIKLNREK